MSEPIVRKSSNEDGTWVQFSCGSMKVYARKVHKVPHWHTQTAAALHLNTYDTQCDILDMRKALVFVELENAKLKKERT